MYHMTHPLTPRKFPTRTVGEVMALVLGVTNDFGILVTPAKGLLHLPVTDSYGNSAGWSMQHSFTG